MMPWAEYSLNVAREEVPRAEEFLQAHGALAVTLLDPADDPVLEPAPGEVRLWPVVELRALFPAGTDPGAVVEALRELPGAQFCGAAAWRLVEDRDWARAWMDGFRPMRFGKHLWIVPSGMQAPDDPGALVVRLDPGLAFGTGTHPTTALCLEWIDGADLAGSRVIDYGCGSGVLGIAAALTGASGVTCVDTDPQALTATADNALRNGVADRIVCVAAEEFGSSSADVVLANILARPLIDMAPRLSGRLVPGGHIVLSGILPGQAEAVAAAYRPFVGPMQCAEREGWVRLNGIAPEKGAS